MRKFLGVISIMTCVLKTHSVMAQTIDYTSLQELFGEAVTTSATGKPQKASNVPVTMDIITADQIRRSGAKTIPQVIGRLAGVVNWQETRSYADVGIRGQNTIYNSSLLVLVNGRQIYIDSYGYTDWTLVPVQLEEIKQIEVVKGPNTALFGFNAVNGVVNIITYNPKYDDVGNAGVEVGTNGYRKAHFLDTLAFSDKANIRFSGGLKEFNQFDIRSKVDTSTHKYEPDQRFSQFNMDGIVQLTENTQLRLEGSRSTGKGEDPADAGNMYLTDKDMYSWRSTLASNTDFGFVEANFYQNTESTDYEGYEARNRVTVAQLSDMFEVGSDHIFRIMGEYRFNTLSGPGLIGDAGSEIYYDSLAASGMWDWALTRTLKMTNALRYDTLSMDRSGPINFGATLFPGGNSYFHENVDAVSANSGLVWRPTEMDTYRVSFSRGIQAPSLFVATEWYYAGSNLVLAGNPKLSPSIVQLYEADYDRAIPQIEGKFRSAFYHRETKDTIGFNALSTSEGADTVLQTINIGETSTNGFELGLSGQFREFWSWDVNYAYQMTDDKFKIRFPLQSLDYEHTLPNHIANAHLGWKKGSWEIDGYMQYGSAFQAISKDVNYNFTLKDIDHYLTTSARIAYIFDSDITLALSGMDISQARVANNPLLKNERQLFLSLSKGF